MKLQLDETQKIAFWTYFDVADEIYEPQSDGIQMKIGDLECRFVDRAKSAADTFMLPWPPDLPAAEEFVLDHPEVRFCHDR